MDALYDEIDRLREIIKEQIDEITRLKKLEVRSVYEELGATIGRLVTEKQTAYGDSFGKTGDVLRILCPDGIKPEQYDDILAITRILDKLFRIATAPTALGESPYQDIVGYGLLGAKRVEQNKV